MQTYKHHHDKDMSTCAIAQMLSTILYGRRFFPYYTNNILAGLDHEGMCSCGHLAGGGRGWSVGTLLILVVIIGIVTFQY